LTLLNSLAVNITAAGQPDQGISYLSKIMPLCKVLGRLGRLKETGIIMVGEDETAAGVDEGGHAAGIMFDIPEMGIIKSQQSTFQKFGYHAMSDDDHNALFTISYYFVQSIQTSLSRFLKGFSIRYFSEV